MCAEVMIRIVIGVEEQLDSDLTACAAAQRGDKSQTTFDEIMEEALTQFLEEAPIIEGCGSPSEEDWELETPSGRFHIRGGRAEPTPGTVPATAIAETLMAMYKEAEDTKETANHYPGR